MSRSERIYCNEDGIDGVTMDFSQGVADLANPTRTLGYAYQKVLQQLGFEIELETIGIEPRIHAWGSLETAREHLPTLQLQRTIGWIAARSAHKEVAFQGSNRSAVIRTISDLSRNVIPDLADDISAPGLHSVLVRPFSEMVTSASVYGSIGLKAPWRATAAERELQARLERLFGRAEIPNKPKRPAEELLALLDTLPPIKSWAERWLESQEREEDEEALERLQERGYVVLKSPDNTTDEEGVK